MYVSAVRTGTDPRPCVRATIGTDSGEAVRVIMHHHPRPGESNACGMREKTRDSREVLQEAGQEVILIAGDRGRGGVHSISQ